MFLLYKKKSIYCIQNAVSAVECMKCWNFYSTLLHQIFTKVHFQVNPTLRYYISCKYRALKVWLNIWVLSSVIHYIWFKMFSILKKLINTLFLNAVSTVEFRIFAIVFHLIASNVDKGIFSYKSNIMILNLVCTFYLPKYKYQFQNMTRKYINPKNDLCSHHSPDMTWAELTFCRHTLILQIWPIKLPNSSNYNRIYLSWRIIRGVLTTSGHSSDCNGQISS